MLPTSSASTRSPFSITHVVSLVLSYSPSTTTTTCSDRALRFPSLLRFPFKWLSFEKQAPVTWASLPYEVQFRILKYLTKRELFVLRRVCKALYQLIHEGRLWSHLDLSEYQAEIPEAQVIQCLTTAGKYLRVVNFRGCHHLTQRSFEVFPGLCPRLHTLDVSGLSHVPYRTLYDLITHLPHLEVFLCTSSPMFQDTHLSHLLRTCSVLRRLDISGCRMLTPHGIHQAFMRHRDLPLQSVWLCNLVVPPQCFPLLLETCPRLTRFAISRAPCLLTPTSPLFASSSMHHCQVTACTLSDPLLAHVVVPMAATLTCLVLTGCTGVTSRGLRCLHTCTHVRFVDMEEVYAFDNDACAALTAAWVHLRYLNLSFCERISDAGLVHVFQPCLEGLEMEQVCKVTEQALKPLVTSLVAPRLRVLKISETCLVSRAFLKQIQGVRPHLQIGSLLSDHFVSEPEELDEEVDEVEEEVEEEEEEEEKVIFEEVDGLGSLGGWWDVVTFTIYQLIQWRWPFSHSQMTMPSQDTGVLGHTEKR